MTSEGTPMTSEPQAAECCMHYPVVPLPDGATVCKACGKVWTKPQAALTAADLTRMRQQHVPYMENGVAVECQRVDCPANEWPCPTLRLLNAFDAAREALAERLTDRAAVCNCIDPDVCGLHQALRDRDAARAEAAQWKAAFMRYGEDACASSVGRYPCDCGFGPLWDADLAATQAPEGAK